MSRSVRRPPELAGTVFRGSEVIARGLLTPAQLRGVNWRQLFRDVYADSALPLDHGLRCRGAALIMPSGAALGGRSAAWGHGVRYSDVTEPVEVIVPPGSGWRSVRGLRCRQADLPPDDILVRGGIRFTAGERTGWDIAGGPDLVESVVMLDALARRNIVTPAGQAARLDTEWRRPGPGTRTRWLRARDALGLMDSRAESPPESRLRVHVIQSGLPKPEPQYEVYDGPIFVARLDLGWPAYRVGLEYDGLWHNNTDDQFSADRYRRVLLGAIGWRIVSVTARQLANDLPGLLSDLRRILAHAGAPV